MGALEIVINILSYNSKYSLELPHELLTLYDSSLLLSRGTLVHLPQR